MKAADAWSVDYSELVTFAGVLDALSVFETAKDAIYFFEKPQKWTPEHERWIALGRPLDLLEIEQLQEDAALADTEPPRDDEAAA